MDLSDLQAEVSMAMGMVFNHYKRPNKVKFYKDPVEEVVYVDPNWNADFGYSDDAIIQKTADFREFDCRVVFLKEPSMIKNIDGDENVGIKSKKLVGELKIQVAADELGLEWLRESDSFYVEGERYVAIADWRGVGALGEYDTYELTLKKDK